MPLISYEINLILTFEQITLLPIQQMWDHSQ